MSFNSRMFALAFALRFFFVLPAAAQQPTPGFPPIPIDATEDQVRQAVALVRAGQKLRKDTKTHQERTLAIDAVTVAVLAERKQHVQALLTDVGVMLAPAAYVFASDPAYTYGQCTDGSTGSVCSKGGDCVSGNCMTPYPGAFGACK